MSETSKSKKQKVIDECQVFNENWKTKYFFTEFDGKAICVICQQSVAVLKDYNLKHYFDSKHTRNYINFSDEERKKFEDLVRRTGKEMYLITFSLLMIILLKLAT